MDRLTQAGVFAMPHRPEIFEPAVVNNERRCRRALSSYCNQNHVIEPAFFLVEKPAETTLTANPHLKVSIKPSHCLQQL